jgi:hypothetical protein
MNFHPKAIVLGVITDLVPSLIVGPVMLLFLGVGENSPYLYHWSLALGLVAVIIGACVTSLKSPSSKVFNAIIFGAIQVLLGLVIVAFVPMPLWFNVTSSVLIIPASLLGAYVTPRTA